MWLWWQVIGGGEEKVMVMVDVALEGFCGVVVVVLETVFGKVAFVIIG